MKQCVRSSEKAETDMKLDKIKHNYWAARRRTAKAIYPRVFQDMQRLEAEAQKSHSGAESQLDTTNPTANDIRKQSQLLWESSQQKESLENYRRGLREYPKDTLLWMAYAFKLQALGKFELAFEAFTNSVELDAGNLEALEQFIDMADRRGEKVKLRQTLKGLPQAIISKPNRHRASLDYAIPYKLNKIIRHLLESPDPVARAVAGMQANDGSNSPGTFAELTPDQVAVARVIWNLGRGRKDEAIKHIRKLPAEAVPASSLRRAIRRELARGREAGAHKLLIEYNKLLPNDNWGKSKLQESSLTSDYEMATFGFQFKQQALETYTANPSGIAYLLHNSLPYHSAGYSTRTHGLLKALTNEGWDIEGITRLGYPYDMPNFKDLGAISGSDLIDGIKYNRLSTEPELIMKRPIQKYVERYVNCLAEHLQQTRPGVIHAASNHWNGLTAVNAAQNLNIGSIYEVRGLWEVTRASRDPEWAESDAYSYMRRMETDAAINASHVITITQALKDEMVTRGVNEDKITVVPNGVDTDRFLPLKKNERLAVELGLQGKTVIGYIGSILDYEGLELLVDAVEQMAPLRNDFKVLIVGDGAALDDLKDTVSVRDLHHLFIFTGRVSHDQVESYYSLVDIAPFPRLPLPVCEMVSPLKPFEAMSMEKAVVASNVGALAEIVSHNQTGLLHQKGDASSLRNALEVLLDRREFRLRLAANARQWVVEHRRWDKLGAKVGDLYKSIGAQPDSQRV